MTIAKLVGALAVSATAGSTSPDIAGDEAEARQAIEAGYGRISQAIAVLDLDALHGVYAPEFKEIAASGAERDLAAMLARLKGDLADAADLSCQVKVETMTHNGRDAVVVARATQCYVGSLGWQTFNIRDEETRHDTWVRSERGWRLCRSMTHISKTWADDKLIHEQSFVLPLTSQERAAVICDLDACAVPFKTVLAGNGFEDLECLDRMIGDARIVALGEASHGTAEFFQMKHRVLEYLVERKGFTVFAIEGNWPEAQVADRFIKTGEGNAAAALDAMHFWTWRTLEVRAMVDAMGSYNLTRGDRPVLSFAGFDMQYTRMAAQCVIDYFDRRNDADCGKVRQLYAGIETLDEGSRSELPAEEKLRLRRNAVEVFDTLDARRDTLLDVSTDAEYRDALQAARIVVQACEMHVGIFYAVRDRAMADNVRWLLEERFPGEKIVLWAHNGHVATAPKGGEKSQGLHLRERYGAQMVVLGFASHHGEVRARRMADGKLQPGPPVALPLAPARPASVEAVFHQSGMPRFILDLRRLPKDGAKDGALGRWLGRPTPHRSIGAGHDPGRDADSYIDAVLPEIYDGLIFIAESTAAKPL
jgi:erythromycin esterase